MRAIDLYARLAAFDRLPDAAIVPDAVAAAVLGISEDTLKRNNPVPWRQVSERRGGRCAGDIRALTRGSAA